MVVIAVRIIKGLMMSRNLVTFIWNAGTEWEIRVQGVIIDGIIKLGSVDLLL